MRVWGEARRNEKQMQRRQRKRRCKKKNRNFWVYHTIFVTLKKKNKKKLWVPTNTQEKKRLLAFLKTLLAFLKKKNNFRPQWKTILVSNAYPQQSPQKKILMAHAKWKKKSHEFYFPQLTWSMKFLSPTGRTWIH